MSPAGASATILRMRCVATRVFPLLPLLLLTACTHTVPECENAVKEFRATLATDPTLAGAPDDAIDAARAHREDRSVACLLANQYADDAESARKNPPPPSTPTPPSFASTPPVGPVGTPRVDLLIDERASQASDGGDRSTPPPPPPPPAGSEPDSSVGSSSVPTPAPALAGDDDGDGESAAAKEAAAAATHAPSGASDSRAACHAKCAEWANFQARVACNQRCDGAAPLPGATASPVVLH